MVGYDRDEDPLNIPKSMKLDVCAWTVLCMAVAEQFCAAILQDAIYKHHRVGDTEPKLFLYHDEALHMDRMIYAPTNADRRCAAIEHRSLWRWYNVPRALTLTPNRQCWEAVLKWMAVDGARSSYCLKIRDRMYNLSQAVVNLKGSMSKMMNQWGFAWLFKNIIKYIYDLLMSEEGQELKRRFRMNRTYYPSHWSVTLWCLQMAFHYDRHMFNPDTHRQNYNLEDLGSVVQEHDTNLTQYCGNDGSCIVSTVFGAATEIDDSAQEVCHHQYWHGKDVFQWLICTIRDFLLKPIWSAKQLQADPPIPVTDEHRKRLMRQANRIALAFDDYCQDYAEREVVSLNFACITHNMMTICWKQWQEVGQLFADLTKELEIADPTLGLCALSMQKQVYLQIVLYAAFLGGSRGSVAKTKKRLLPLLHKHLFEGFATQQAAERSEAGQVTEVRGAGPMSKGQSLQVLVAEQRPGPNDLIFVPGPSVPKWASARIPDRFEEMIYVQNEDGEMEQMEVDLPTVGEVIAEDDEAADQGAELRAHSRTA